ncbi:nitroreductase/quinone reductase family protein [Streptomyces spinosirectus]|jgi:deazaflavin-dependent oxidoreductase (nitroreductase family)|uniref:nitroreductase/quinone reductase family protein n=1 Tax=Streptomyces TaxID=1883 RepID=UPI000D37762A|nr:MULTISPECIES: nitroreductase/quinone reductase family protein [Streptomyces]MBY8339336.1 nitroreductase family deazaflavin-dependent oxidoreductase [Streptomyces plumbidurans]PTM93061.1 deazaflavin-dependent oxidoreductase (nitroreductase family) [Streptomyces sp. VMFN-G11Ma]UIR16128.1 nitroreductase/quinone reductase family protein [Streptomyces spinosirectus]
MADRTYLKPPWMQQHVGNRLAPLFGRSVVSRLSVRGRTSGRRRTVPVAVLEYEGERYLVSYRGLSDWALNLRATPECRLTVRGRTEELIAEEIPEAERPPIMAAYREKYGGMPTVSSVLTALPDPADHPVFRLRSRG